MGAEARSQGREPLDVGSSSDPEAPEGRQTPCGPRTSVAPPGLERRARGSRSIVQGLTPLATSGRPSGALGTDSERFPRGLKRSAGIQ